MNKKVRLKLIIMTIIFTIVMIISILSPYIFKDVNALSFEQAFEKPSFKHLFGTDNFGRDMFQRILYGLRTSIFLAILIEFLSFVIGCIIGLILGYYGGIIDDIFTVIMNVLIGFPNTILALCFFSIFGQGTLVLVLIITMTHWIKYAKLIRAQVISIKNAEFVQYVKGIGASKPYIIFNHILLNAITPIIPMATLMVGHMVMIISGLAFLGFGVQPPTPEIGIMLKESIVYIEKAPWLMIFPGLALFLCSLFFNIYGDAIRDYLDPRSNLDIDKM